MEVIDGRCFFLYDAMQGRRMNFFMPAINSMINADTAITSKENKTMSFQESGMGLKDSSYPPVPRRNFESARANEEVADWDRSFIFSDPRYLK